MVDLFGCEELEDQYEDCIQQIGELFPFPNHYNGLIANVLVSTKKKFVGYIQS